MITRISVRNHLSFDHIDIDLRIDGRVPKSPKFRRLDSDIASRVPVLIGFFGPNASGKSNLITSIVLAREFIRNSFAWPASAPLPFSTQAKNESLRHPTRIEIEFETGIIGDQIRPVRYILEIGPIFDNQRKTAFSREVILENLSFKQGTVWKSIVERKKDHVNGSKFMPIGEITKYVTPRKNVSVISTLAQFGVPVATEFVRSLDLVLSNIPWDFTPTQPSALAHRYETNESLLSSLNRRIRLLDLGLVEVKVDHLQGEPHLTFVHRSLDHPLHWIQESRGTRQFLEIFPILDVALQSGSVALVDELDTAIHPLLLPEILSWFQDPLENPHNAQLFFCAHNPVLFDILTKEEVFLVSKDADGCSSIQPAQDIEGLRRDHSLSRAYLSGRLGAIPNVG
jgi:uncharacterized protein